MNKSKKTNWSSHVLIALATGTSIIVLAYFSKRVLPEPLSYLELAGPPFIMVIYESVISNEKWARLHKPLYWIAAIFVATALIILLNAR